MVRHGEAVSEEIDPKRPLSEKGRKEVLKVAQFLKGLGIELNLIWHSRKLRAKETAQLFAEAIFPQQGIIEKEGLAPLDPIGKIKEEIDQEERDLMVIGHLPFLAKLASLILTGNDSYNLINLQSAGVVCLEREDNNWTILWIITPDLIKE